MFHIPWREAPVPRVEATTAPSAADDDGRTCGWFDSSHDLQRGLVVHEHASLAEVREDLPLDDWLQWHATFWWAEHLQVLSAHPRSG